MGKRTNEISSIVDTINLIAERTNLLSLNASIEAARAGDAGRGFAVVAEEIRNLADRSAKATADIAAIIRALQEVAQDAVNASTESLRIADESNTVAEAGAAGLRKILAGVGDTAGLVGQIARASDEQRTAGRSVTAAITATSEQARVVATATAEQATAAGTIVQSTGQMRKIAQEVSKAVTEQGRASRDIMKAAQSGAKLALAVRKATTEQSAAATQLTQQNETIRRGALTTSKAVGEQASAAEQITKATADLSRQIGAVSRAMAEQTTAAAEITTAVDSMRAQGDQAARASAEQARTMREMLKAANANAKDIKLITHANVAQSTAAARLVTDLADIRKVTERNVEGVKQTQGGTADLLRQAEALVGIMGHATTGRQTNGRGR